MVPSLSPQPSSSAAGRARGELDPLLGAAGGAEHASSGRSRQRVRNRIPKSCLTCLSGKRACDRQKPTCGRCTRMQQLCTYADEPLPVPRVARKSATADASDGDAEHAAQESTSQEDAEPTASTSEHKRRKVIHHHEPISTTDSDVHRAGQALVNLQAHTSWSRDSPSPNVSVLSPIRRSYADERGIGSSSSSNSSSSFGSHGNNEAHGPRSTSSAETGGAPLSERRFSRIRPSGLRESVAADEAEAEEQQEVSHVNVNGQPLWHGGDSLMSTSVFERANGTVDSMEDDDDESHVRRPSIDEGVRIPATHIQNAFNGLLYPMTDSFPFETIWSSGSNFKQEVLPLLPSAKKGKAVLDAFKSFIRIASPGLMDSTILAPAYNFLCKRKESEREMISLPWLASFFMIVAVGQETHRKWWAPTASGMGDLGAEGSEEEGSDEEEEIAEADEQKGSGQETGSRSGIDTEERSQRSTPSSRQPNDVRKHGDLLLSATYQALRLCSFLGSPNLQTIYAQVLIGVYLLHTERASNAWPILGSITRQAQSIGLHVEPSSMMRKRMSTEERELRRKLWWTIVQQDVLLSSVFGRPLSVSRFTCRIVAAPANDGTASSLTRTGEKSVTYQEALCELTIFARRYINEDQQEQEWTEDQVRRFKDELLAWYRGLPPSIRIADASNEEGWAANRSMRDRLSHRSPSMIQHSVDLCLMVQFTLLSLYRSRLVSLQTGASPESATRNRPEGPSVNPSPTLNENSLQECSNCVHTIALATSSLNELLGTLQAGMLWIRVFYAFHAGVTAAYLALSRATTAIGARAREDLRTLTEACQRLPDRFDGLKTVTATFVVLTKLVQAHSAALDQKRVGALSNTKATPSSANDASGGVRDTGHAYQTEQEPNADSTRARQSGNMNMSPWQLDQLLMTDNLSIPAFNIGRDTTLSGVAPFLDQPSNGGNGVATALPSAATATTIFGQNPIGSGEAHLTSANAMANLMANSDTLNANIYEDEVSQTPSTFVHGQQQAAQAVSSVAADRGFPEPFGPMIAPPGPEASTGEIVNFWREFFALPFQTSDLGLS